MLFRSVRDAALNLLLNACQVSKQGGSVGFKACAAADALVLEFQDSGGGIPDHVREYVERKGAGSAPLDRRSGLGLWIVKRLCDEMGATMHVPLSGVDGTTIELRIPLSKNEIKNAA